LIARQIKADTLYQMTDNLSGPEAWHEGKEQFLYILEKERNDREYYYTAPRLHNGKSFNFVF